MNYAIAKLYAIPIRKTPKHQAEMVSQMLAGETCKIEAQNGDWLKITTVEDGYKGYVAANQIDALLNHKAHNKWLQDRWLTPFYVDKNTNDYLHGVPPGGFIHKTIFQSQQIYNTAFTLEAIVSSFHDTPYLWGGKTPFGCDCSGFTQVVFKILGYKLPRDSSKQFKIGKPISKFSNAQKGDLLFFNDKPVDNKKAIVPNKAVVPNKAIVPNHVGIYLDNNFIAHISGCFKTDKVDNKGIIKKSTKANYTHYLLGIKRVLA